MTKLLAAFILSLALLSSCLTALAFAPPSPIYTKSSVGSFSGPRIFRSLPFDEEQSVVSSNAENNETGLESLATLKEDETVDLWEDESKNVEVYFLLAWGISLSIFILVNNFVGPWPMPQMEDVPERFWRATHVISGMLFGGGIIITTAIEWLVASNKNPPVLQFWFDKVPLLDAVIVLPSLTISVISGTGVAIENYGGLGTSPPHIAITFYALVAFATWWAATDLTTQGKTLVEVNEWVIASTNDNGQEMPKIVTLRRISNIVSCLFVLALFAIMILKPGVIYLKEIAPLFES